MISFDQFLSRLNEGRAGSKTGLYPLGYDGIGNYPPAYMMPTSADTLYYLSIDDRFAGWWEGKPFDITHIHGEPVEPKGHSLPGKEVPHKPSDMPGKPMPPKYRMPAGIVKKPAESPLPGAPTKDCLVKKMKTGNPQQAGRSAEKSVCASWIPE